MSLVDSTMIKVQQYLTQLGNPVLDSDGDLSLRHGSARVFVRVRPLGDDDSVVEIFCPTLDDVTPSPALYEYVATENSYRFGKLSVDRRDNGKVAIRIGHALLGTYLDPEELNMAVALTAALADQLDDELQSKFGGRRFHEG